MPTIILSKKSEKYLHKNAQLYNVVFGIMIGQQTGEERINVIHLAQLSEDEEYTKNPSQFALSPFENINVQSLADQWISASKMTPGSFNVLGIFIASKSDYMADDKHTESVKKLLKELHRLITSNNSTFGYTEYSGNLEIFLLSCATDAMISRCKTFSTSPSGNKLSSIECRYVDNLPQWYLFETNYELDEVFPISDNREHINIEKQFYNVLEAVKINIGCSQIFIEQQDINDKTTLENYIKENFKKNDVPILKASIFLTAHLSNEYLIKVREFNGTIRFYGIVSSRVWFHSKSTFEEIKNGIKNDILRSLAARIQIYCDGLTDLHSNNVDIVVSEPPRRIYFKSECQEIQFSEYIFRGETPSVAVAQAKQVLDIDINSDYIFDDLEGLHDDEVSVGSEDSSLTNKKNTASEISRSMYMLGIAVALLVLLVSVLIHFLFL